MRVLVSELDASGARRWILPGDHAGREHGQAVVRLANAHLLVRASAAGARLREST